MSSSRRRRSGVRAGCLPAGAPGGSRGCIDRGGRRHRATINRSAGVRQRTEAGRVRRERPARGRRANAKMTPCIRKSLPFAPTLRRSTSMRSSMRPTPASWAEAASTARSIARPDPNCSPNAGALAAARPAMPRSRAAIACRPVTSSTRSGRCGMAAAPASRNCWPRAIGARSSSPSATGSRRSRFRRSAAVRTVIR